LSPLVLLVPAHHSGLVSFPTRRSSDLMMAPPRLVDLCGDQPVKPGARLVPAPVRLLKQRAADDGGLLTVDFQDDLCVQLGHGSQDRKSTRLNSSHVKISYAVFCLKKKK